MVVGAPVVAPVRPLVCAAVDPTPVDPPLKESPDERASVFDVGCTTDVLEDGTIPPGPKVIPPDGEIGLAVSLDTEDEDGPAVGLRISDGSVPVVPKLKNGLPVDRLETGTSIDGKVVSEITTDVDPSAVAPRVVDLVG